MTNLNFLQNIKAPIVKITERNLYYAYISNILGGYADDGYLKGIYVNLNDEFLNNTNLEDYVKNFTINSEIIEGIILSPKINPEIDVKDISFYNILASTDYSYYSKLNEILNSSEINEDDINNLYQTFAKIINYYAFITDMSLTTQIYKNVLKFYANGQYDETLNNLNLILNTSTYNYNNTANYKTCGCPQNSLSGDNTTKVLSCVDSYKNALNLYLIQMFGDIDFYNNFFFIEDGEPNSDMIDYLIDLLEAFLKLDVFGKNISKTSHCKCPDIDKNDQYKKIVENYIKVLNWIKNCQIEENTNKIKVYGKDFGEIFPNLFIILN